jgi:uncharacterized protein (TIGR03067 family)
MNATRQALTAGALLALMFAFASTVPAAEADRFAGTWIFEAADQERGSLLGQAWTSKVVITGNSFSLSRFMGTARDLKGTLVLDPAANPKTIDLKIAEFDLSESGAPVKFPAGTVPGIYKLDGERLTICFTPQFGSKRPTGFAPTGANRLLTLVRAPASFKDFPQEVTMKVTGPDGKPVPGATVTRFMSLFEDPKKKEAKRDWTYSEVVKTAADGTIRTKYEQLAGQALIVRDLENRRIAFAAPSPAALLGGEMTVSLKPECRLSGTIVCDQLKKAGKPIGWTNVYLMHAGRRLAMNNSREGKFEFIAPPGKHQMYAYGEDVIGKVVPVTVPAGQKEFTPDPVALPATKLKLLEGQPAPEFEGVIGWKGKPVKLADLKGKYVMLEFWGYWCGPCIQVMPVFIELHEKFADKGLVIVGVHMDTGGEVDTVAKLDEKIAGYRKKYWKGKDLPFPVALMSGKEVGEGETKTWIGPAGQYGVRAWPTTVLIDRDGKVVGKFTTYDVKAASAKIEKLLKEKK